MYNSCVEDKIYFLAKDINEEINNHHDVVLLNKLEKELNESYEVYLLSNKKDEALEKYISNKDAYGEDSEITKESLKTLSLTKEELNNHPLVKEYLEVYSRVRDLLLEVDDILLGEYKRGHC